MEKTNVKFADSPAWLKASNKLTGPSEPLHHLADDMFCLVGLPKPVEGKLVFWLHAKTWMLNVACVFGAMHSESA